MQTDKFCAKNIDLYQYRREKQRSGFRVHDQSSTSPTLSRFAGKALDSRFSLRRHFLHGYHAGIPGGPWGPVFPRKPCSSLALSCGPHDLLGLSFIFFYFIACFEFVTSSHDLRFKTCSCSAHSVVVKKNYFTNLETRKENFWTFGLLGTLGEG